MSKVRGYKEWITNGRISFITNSFGRILYVNPDWPDGKYEKWSGISKGLTKQIRKRCHPGREFNKEELMLELL
jgi:hypothetical protein